MANTSIDRDERHPLMNPAIAGIDNNTLNNILNSIIKSNTINETSQNQTDGSTQYLLPVDLLVSIDNKSNVPTVQAALPSSFAVQPSLPLQYPTYFPSAATSPMSPLSINYCTNTQTPQMPQVPSQQSSLNPSAPSFTPYTPYTPIINKPIFEKENEENDENDEWCMYDDEDEDENDIQPIQKETKTIDPFKPKQRYSINNNSDKRAYNKNWRNYTNHSNHTNHCNHSNQWRNKSKNMHVSYRFSKYGATKNNSKTTKLLAEFIRHVTLPNRDKYPPNTILTKTWAMRNCGENEWGYNVELVYCKGDETLSLYHRYPVINALSGQEIEISATIKTPIQSGRYCTYFRLQKNGRFFGPRVWVDIIVTDLDQINTLKMKMTKHCACVNNQNDDKVLPQKAMKWKKKYATTTKNEAHNHYKVVTCK